MDYAFYYNLATSFGAYFLLLVLGIKMKQFVRNNFKGPSNQKKLVADLNRQLTQTLIVQASFFVVVWWKFMILIVVAV